MTDEGNRDADLWANTDPHPASPPTPSANAMDPTQVQPVMPSAVAPGGIPPMTPPSIPPTGGGGFGVPTGGQPPAGGRSQWGGPATIGILVGGVIAAIVVLALTRSGDDSVQTVDESTTTVLIDTTIPAETPIDPATTVGAEATVPSAETTIDPTTTELTESTLAPTTTPATTAAPTGPAPAAPGTVRVDGVEYSIERSCFTVPLAPDYTDLQVFSHLISIDGTSAVVEQWFDEGGITDGAFAVRGFAADTGKFLELDQGYAFEAPAGSGEFSIVANPTNTGSDCASEQGIQTFGANDKPRYLRALIDTCFTSNDAGESTKIGYGSDLGRVEIRGDAAGEYLLTYSDPAVQLDGAPAEVLADGSSVSYRAPLANGSVLVTTQDNLLRDCTSADLE
ncbi:MAG: hypothetical protein ACI9N0_003288 [Ilumatobacter sp.]|jgi:hypothetical protein